MFEPQDLRITRYRRIAQGGLRDRLAALDATLADRQSARGRTTVTIRVPIEA